MSNYTGQFNKIMKEKIALTIVLLWPIIPIFWIILHGIPKLVKRIKFFIYPLVFLIFIGIAYILLKNKSFLFSTKIHLQYFLNICGYLIFFSGLILHTWTLLLLTLPGITGVPEIKNDKNFSLITKGPFSIVRHPTYLAHTMIFLGAFLFTQYTILLIITFLDFLLVNLIIIPLEEKELTKRMGEKYIQYQKKVRWKFIPFIF